MTKKQTVSKKNPIKSKIKQPTAKNKRKKISTKSKEKISQKAYSNILRDLKKLIADTRNKTLRTVNKALIELYLKIGEKIVIEQEKQGWGKNVVKQLSQDLRMVFSDMSGLSLANLWRTRQFYLYYRSLLIDVSPKNKKLATLLRENFSVVKLKELLYSLSWSHHTVIMGSCKDDMEKEFYLRIAVSEKWSVRELRRQIDTDLFTRYLANLDCEPNKTLPTKNKNENILPFKDEYILDFLGLKEKYSETELRKAIIHNLRDFFLEFGRGLAFIAEEFTLTVGQGTFRVDLLFFHRDLQTLVAVELKIGPFKPEYVGKMQFYLSALDEQEKREHEKPSVGLILCKSKDKEQVRIALTAAASKIGVAAYKTAFPDEKKLKEHLRKLPLNKNEDLS